MLVTFLISFLNFSTYDWFFFTITNMIFLVSQPPTSNILRSANGDAHWKNLIRTKIGCFVMCEWPFWHPLWLKIQNFKILLHLVFWCSIRSRKFFYWNCVIVLFTFWKRCFICSWYLLLRKDHYSEICLDDSIQTSWGYT